VVAAIIPAYNEAERIRPVLDTLLLCREVGEILAVDDGSDDGTARVAESHPLAREGRLRVLRHPENRGKGCALRTGASATGAETLLLLDADLIGLNPDHVRGLLKPVQNGAAMSVGLFRGGRGMTTLSHLLFPFISGQRAVRRSLLLSTPGLEHSGFGVEISLTRRVRAEGLSIAYVELRGVSHAMKEEKFGLMRGAARRFRMYQQMIACLFRR
jgi:polyisoprenyl-phosphate glycosyltransferase